MAFEISSEQEMIRMMARDFAKKELEPHAAEWDRQGIFPMEAVKKMGELGLLGMMVPPELGGSGAGAVAINAGSVKGASADVITTTTRTSDELPLTMLEIIGETTPVETPVKSRAASA